MSGKNTAVFGIYPSYANAEGGVDGLRAAGFSNKDISVLFPASAGTREGTKAPEGATAGAGTGIVLGGALGWLLGVGALAVPGLGPFIAAGPIMATLAGVRVGGTVGVVAGALAGMGIPEYEAKRFEGRVKDGGILLSVHSGGSDNTKRAKLILEATGAQDISSTGEAHSDRIETDADDLRQAS
jgi:hypothetical protein